MRMTSYQYRKSYWEDNTILRPSYLHNGISYIGKTTSLYWIRAQKVMLVKYGYLYILIRSMFFPNSMSTTVQYGTCHLCILRKYEWENSSFSSTAIISTIHAAIFLNSIVFIRTICKREGGIDSGEDTILGAVSIRKTVLSGMAIPMLKIRRPNGRLIFNMEIAIRR